MKVYPDDYKTAHKRKKSKKNEDVGGVSLFAASLRHQTTEFFNNSTLHGVRYIAEKERPFCEKFMWFSFTAIGAVTTCIIIVSLWEKFQTNPTITGLDTDFHNWDVPFPAVTMCDLNPVDEDLLQEYVETVYGPDPPEKAADMLRWLATLTYSSIEERAAEFVNDQDLMGRGQTDVADPSLEPKEAVYKIVRHCESLYFNCEWKGDSEECCDILLMPVFTEMGFCYAFNSRHAEKSWPCLEAYNRNNFIEVEDELEDEIPAIPALDNFRDDNAGTNLPTLSRSHIQEFSERQTQVQPEQFVEAFIHETDAKWSFMFNSDRKNTTIDIYIHSTEEMAGLEQSAQHSWDHRVEKVSFSVKHTYTTEDARQLSIKQRRCVFADEQKLETSPTYTFSACMRQCRMQRSRTYCKCVPHFYPTMLGYRQCTVRELECIAKHAATITDVTQCTCELGCTHTVYEVEKLSELDKGTESNSLETEFVSWPMVRYKREVLFGWVDLLVSFGGIAGLFLGFSLLSGVELIYYFTLRACCAAVRDADVLKQERAERQARAKPPHNLSLVPWWKQPPAPISAPSQPIMVNPKNMDPPRYSPPPGYTTYLP